MSKTDDYIEADELERRKIWVEVKKRNPKDHDRILVELKHVLETEEDIEQFKTEILKFRSGKKSFYLFVAAVASIVLIVLSVFVLLNREVEESLFSSYYKPYQIMILRHQDTRQRPEVTNLYLMERYEDVINVLEGEDQLTDLQLIIVGCSYIEANNYDLAYLAFEQIDSNSSYLDIARWYKSLLHIKKDEKDEAKLLLKELTASGRYSKVAMKLLNDL